MAVPVAATWRYELEANAAGLMPEAGRISRFDHGAEALRRVEV
jgi:hypothetical protein